MSTTFTISQYTRLCIAKFIETENVFKISWQSLASENMKGMRSLINTFSKDAGLGFQIEECFDDNGDAIRGQFAYRSQKDNRNLPEVDISGFMCPESWTRAFCDLLFSIFTEEELDFCKKEDYKEWMLGVNDNLKEGSYYYFDDKVAVGGIDDDGEWQGLSALECPCPGAIIGMIMCNSTFEFGMVVKEEEKHDMAIKK